MTENNENKRKVQCNKCGKWISIYTTDVLNKITGEKSVLYSATCSRCRHTVYMDTIDELVEMYIAEGKNREEAVELAKRLQKFLHSDNVRQMRSWYRNHWERTREKEEMWTP